MQEEIKITPSTTKEEIVEIANQIIWSNPGIDTYAILSKLISMGYKFESKEKFFREVIGKIKIQNNYVRSNKDQYIVCKPITLEAQVMSLYRRGNCYDCDFLKKTTDNYKLKCVIYEEREEDTHHYCALNPTLNIRLGMHNIPDRCPLNLALDKIKEDNVKEESKNA